MTSPLRRFPLHPAHPERICWGCDHYCPTHAMRCGNGSVPTPHPCELFGDTWHQDAIATAEQGGSSPKDLDNLQAN